MKPDAVPLAYLRGGGTAGNSIKPKQWRLNDPIKSGQDKAIRVALIVIGMKQAATEPR